MLRAKLGTKRLTSLFGLGPSKRLTLVNLFGERQGIVTQDLCIFQVESVGVEKANSVLILIHFLFLLIPFLVNFSGEMGRIRHQPLISRKNVPRV